MVIKIVLLCSVAACVLAAPSPNGVIPLEKQQPTVIPILTQSEELEANGTYKFSYETANGIKREEVSYNKILPKVEGRSKSGSSESGESGSDESNEIHVQQGSYSYTAPDGTLITVRYIADENGFRVFGDHLPKTPALIQQIQARTNAKSSRTLKSDNVESESAPAVVAAEKPVEASVKLESRIGSDASAAVVSTAAAAPQEPATEVSAVKVAASNSAAVPATVAVTEKSEDASTLASEPSTTESASTTAAVAPSEGSTPSSEATTTESASTTAAEVTSSEASSTSASEVTTTEAASTSAAASTIKAESAKTEAASTSAAEQSTTEAASSSAEAKSTAASEAASTEAQSSPESTTTEAASSTTSA